MVALLLLTLSVALADDPNKMPTAHVAVVHTAADAHPWGVRLGGDLQFAVGDHCSWAERDCRSSTGLGSVWPVAGPAASVMWRGGNRFVLEGGAEVGVGALDMHHFGFAPLWEVVARVGFRFETDGSVGSVALGGFVSKSFSPNLVVRSGRQRGVDGAGVRVDVDTAWAFDRWRPVAVGGGLWSVAGSMSDYNMVPAR